MNLPKQNYIGCIVGGAIGDALGAPIEFLDIYQIRQKYGLDGVANYVEFKDYTGGITDDTQMTLFTAEALLRAYHRYVQKGIGGALNTIAHHSYLRWLYTQDIGVDCNNIKLNSYDIEKGWLIKQKALYKRRAPGNTCLVSLSSGIAGTIDKPINDSKGCGTIMRMAPVGLMYDNDPEYSFQIGCELAAITHGHPTGWLSAGFFASVISSLAAGKNLEIAINDAVINLKKWNNHQETLQSVKEALNLFEKSKNNTTESIENLGQGWIAEEALSMSIYTSLLFEKDFEKGILFSINHSGDSDSIGSITGNILGLINGIDQIPKKLIDNLKEYNIVKQIGEDLYIKIKGDSYNSDDEWWDKYPGF